MKRLMILGASGLQLPAILKAKEMDLIVGVIDYNPDAVGVEYADEFFCISTVDELGVCEATKSFRADGIITLATDMPTRSVAFTCEKLGLNGITYSTAVRSTDKVKMIRAFAEHNVPHPWFYVLHDASDLTGVKDMIKYPCICKPTDSSGSRGVVLIQDKSQLESSVLYSLSYSRHGKAILEEYLQGQEVSVEVIVLDCEPFVLAVTDKTTSKAPHFVETGHSQPSCLDDISLDQIKNTAIQAVKAIGITTGAAHVEIMMTRDGPKMIELGARLGGDCITTHLVPNSTGIDMVKAVIHIALDEKPDIETKWSKGAAIRYMSAPPGRIMSISDTEELMEISGIVDIVLNYKVGDTLKAMHSSLDRIGYVIATGENAQEAISRCEMVLKKINIRIET